MNPLHVSFLQCLVLIIIGQVIRLLKLKTPEQKRSISFITKIVIQVTLPCLLLRSMSQLRSFPFDGVLLMLMYIAYNIVAAVMGIILYHRRPVEEGAGLAASLMGMNVGVFFYPIMEQIAGAPGVARLAMYDTANELFVFLVYPRIFDWARRKYKRKVSAESQKQQSKLESQVQQQQQQEQDPRSSQDLSYSERRSEDSHGDVEMEHIPVHDPKPIMVYPHDHEGHFSSQHMVHPHQLRSPTPLQRSSSSAISTPMATPTPSISETPDLLPSHERPERIQTVSPNLTAPWDTSARPATAPLPSEERYNRHIKRASTLRARAKVFFHENPHGRRIMSVLKFVWSVISVLPLDAIIIGLAIGVGGQTSLPPFIDSTLLKAANANTLLGMVLLGMLLDLSPKRLIANARDTVIAVGVRYVIAISATAAFYFGVGPTVESDLTRLVFAIGLFMPVPIVCGAYTLESGFNPNVEALIINVTMVCSFFMIWLILTFVPMPSSSSSSSSSSSLSDSLSSTATTAGLPPFDLLTPLVYNTD